MDGKGSSDMPDGAARRDVPKDAASRIDRRPRAEDWFYIWGEIEQALRMGGGLGPVPADDIDEPGAGRGGHSLPSSLLIHADISREVRAQYGREGLEMIALLYVYGWEWEEEVKSERVSSGGVIETRTGRYYRKYKQGATKGWQDRRIASIVRSVGRALGLK